MFTSERGAPRTVGLCQGAPPLASRFACATGALAHAALCFTPNPVELRSGRPNSGATQSFGEKLRLRHDSFGWPDAVVQLLFGSRF